MIIDSGASIWFLEESVYIALLNRTTHASEWTVINGITENRPVLNVSMSLDENRWDTIASVRGPPPPPLPFVTLRLSFR